MNQYVNEEVMWQRVKDMQMEAENRRRFGPHAVPNALGWIKFLGARAWLLAGLAMRRPPRHRWTNAADARDAGSRVA